jgi:hypothetical protein
MLKGTASSGPSPAQTDPDLFVRVVASPEVSFRSPTVVDALSHVFHFRVSVPVDAIPNSGIELYVQNDSGRGKAEAQEVIGSIRLRRKQLLEALSGDGLLRLDDKEGGLERIEVAVAEGASKGLRTQGTLDLSKNGLARVPGIDINAGDVVEVSAAGAYELEGGRVTPAGIAANEQNFTDLRDSPHGAAFAVVGEDGHFSTFLTGSCRRFVAPNEGLLIVGVNDQRGDPRVKKAKKSKKAQGVGNSAPPAVAAGSITFLIKVRPPSAEEWRTGLVPGGCEQPGYAAVAAASSPAEPASVSPPAPSQAGIATDEPPRAAPPAVHPQTQPGDWRRTAAFAVQQLMRTAGPGIAASIQRILHPSGGSPMLQGTDSLPSANGLTVRIATAWHGLLGARHLTTVGWEISPQGHVRATVLSDSKGSQFSARRLEELDAYFATRVYPGLAQSLAGTY